MKQTTASAQKRRPLLAAQMDLGVNTGATEPRQYLPYLGTAARYSGMPLHMEHRIGPNAPLQDANLSYSDLRWGNFRKANLRGANLQESILWGAILTNANLRGANLSYADFTGADLSGADLSHCLIEGTCFLGARYNAQTKFPAEFGHPESKGLLTDQESSQIGVS